MRMGYKVPVPEFSYSPPVWAALVAGFLVLVSLSISACLLFEHLSAYKNPEVQKFPMEVILMVPWYAHESVGRRGKVA